MKRNRFTEDQTIGILKEHARAVFNARITPWPVELALQIWNCPMWASINRERRPRERLSEIALPRSDGPRPQSRDDRTAELFLAQDQSDIDIADQAHDFVRSIHVFQIEYQRHRNKVFAPIDVCWTKSEVFPPER